MSSQPSPTFTPQQSFLSNHALVFDSSGNRRQVDDLGRELTVDLDHHINLCNDLDSLMAGLQLHLPPALTQVPLQLPSGTQQQAIESLSIYLSQCGGDAGNY